MRLFFVLFALILSSACSLAPNYNESNSAKQIGVVLGDSIAAGLPSCEGFFHAVLTSIGWVGVFHPENNQNVYGQFSYFLEKRNSNFHWYNLGIGGQTTDMVTNWDRDVLAQTNSFCTIPEKATIIFIHCGVNDVLNSIDSSQTKKNILEMTEKATKENIKVYISEIPFVSILSLTNKIQSINCWLHSLESKNITVIYGEYEFSEANWNNPLIYIDGLHPTKLGYQLLSKLIPTN